MDVAYIYRRQRQHFGQQLNLENWPVGNDEEEDLAIIRIPSNKDFIKRVGMVHMKPCVIELDTSPEVGCSTVATNPTVRVQRGMTHQEGGWPSEIDVDDEAALTRFRKRREKGTKTKGSGSTVEPLGASVKRLGPVVQLAVKQNNTINIYEEYFDEFLPDHSSEPPSAKGMAVLRDPCSVRRTASTIDWHPDGPSRIAVSYSIMRFQDPRLMQKTMPVNSYLWDVQKPNAPETTLTPNSPLCSLRFNTKNPETLVGGCYNGLVCFFDRRKQGKPHAISVIETSHHDPVYDVRWIQSKTGTLCASCSTDGRMLWWDTRRLHEPYDANVLQGADGKRLGASSMAYNTEAGPHKYLVGTEQGVVAAINTRNKKQNNGVQAFSKGPGKHHGPIYSIERNPAHMKYFMTVGDWTARIWTEDLKTPIMTTKYHTSYLTSGCWSPTRPGVFFVTRKDGVLDVWDYFFRQNEVAYTHKVCEEPLSSIGVSGGNHQTVQLVAIGDDSGTVSLLELSDSLAMQQNNEKPAMAGMFDRETRREKNLVQLARETAKRQKRLDQENEDAAARQSGKGGSAVEEELMKIEQNFVEMVKDDGSNDSRMKK